ncbi:MAG TPA: LysR family transcriptional regulator [Candidatus Margulisiibacteriota bacterium]|nr:LysR family transcriptional regulator [Candidatus Margulisiibacteriota bacterium]
MRERKGQHTVSPATRKASNPSQLVVRIKLGGDAVLGPGKAELLENIDRLGSLSAAARAMRMSYRQAWMLLDTMNQAFRARLVETSQGGPGGGGAVLTRLGKRILVCYRKLQQKAAESTHDDLAALLRLRATGLQSGVRKRLGSQRPRDHGSSG